MKEEFVRRFPGMRLSMLVAISACLIMPTGATGEPQPGVADVIVHNARIVTLSDGVPEASALAVRGEKFIAVGTNDEVMEFRGARTRVIDAGGRRVIPGLNDSHIHAVRGGRFYTLELRWDGVESLEQGLRMIRDQAQRTPKRVTGCGSSGPGPRTSSGKSACRRLPNSTRHRRIRPCSSCFSTARGC